MCWGGSRGLFSKHLALILTPCSNFSLLSRWSKSILLFATTPPWLSLRKYGKSWAGAVSVGMEAVGLSAWGSDLEWGAWLAPEWDVALCSQGGRNGSEGEGPPRGYLALPMASLAGAIPASNFGPDTDHCGQTCSHFITLYSYHSSISPTKIAMERSQFRCVCCFPFIFNMLLDVPRFEDASVMSQR